MKKLCKLFYTNDVLGKWIVYDSETKLVSELKKFDEQGETISINLLEQGMFEKGILELDHCIKFWEVELILSEIPAIPDQGIISIGWPRTDIVYGSATWSSGGGSYSYSSSSSTSHGEGIGTHAEGGGSQNINEQNISNNSNSMPSFEVSDMIPVNAALLISEGGVDKFFVNNIEVGKNYKREDGDFNLPS